ncbi:hypothetical protein GOD41_33020 [Sinorhizobium medicae]|nr:hypothetical protein [Sinorhizobium medicae]
MSLKVFSLRERSDLIPSVFSPKFDGLWPNFMRQNQTAKLYFGKAVFIDYLDYAFVGLIDEEVVARAFGVPFALNVDGRAELPDGGWDQVIRWAHEDKLIGRKPNTMSALEITLAPKARGIGNALAMLGALKTCARNAGFDELSVPVRPNQKQRDPRLPMDEYIKLQRADGSPVDSWLRTHIAVGGRILKIAPYSFTIAGTIAEWSSWTGIAFERSGMVEIDGALVPMLVSIEHNYGIYAEPNVWIRHAL